MSEYKPIACALHEQYQFAVMKQVSLDLVWDGESGGERRDRVRPKDVYTREKAEYLLIDVEHVGEIEIRLDRIREARWVENGKLLGG